MYTVEEMKAHRKQQANILRRRRRRSIPKEPSSTYWPQQCKEEKPSPQFYGQS
jgi:hypothetical protein